MYPSATLCQAQQAVQLRRAADATLDNVRSIAEKAAAAWGIEAKIAADRERRHAKTQEVRLAKAETDRAFSENPDRGFADADRKMLIAGQR